MRTLIFLFAFGLASTLAVQAQSPLKIGFADVDYIFSEMPEAKQIETELQSTQNQLKKEIDTKAAEFKKKLDDYTANLNTMLPAVRSNTERHGPTATTRRVSVVPGRRLVHARPIVHAPAHRQAARLAPQAEEQGRRSDADDY